MDESFRCNRSGSGYCVSGCGQKSKDCLAEWYVASAPSVRLGGHTLVYCRPGESCDADGDGTDETCTFRLALCFNTTDPRLDCDQVGVRSFTLLSPNPLNPRSTGRDVLNGSAILRALTASPLGGTSSTSEPSIAFTPDIADTNVCSDVFEVKVALGHTRAGTPIAGRLKLRSLVVSPPVPGGARRGVKDSDLLSLACYP